jgi:hypothetical protein
MRGPRFLTLAALALATTAVLSAAHVRLLPPGISGPLYWNNPTNVGIVINSTGSDDITDGSHETAIRMAIQSWNDVSGTTPPLVENTDPVQQARTDYGNTNIHLVMFDENNTSGWFPSMSGTVAITPLWFFGSGRISDADILFNGRDFNFTTRAEPGAFDVQDVAAHEIGHLLGFDHTGVAGGTMYPYVDPSVREHRSLSRDEFGGMRNLYGSGPSGSITGHVQRSSDSSNVLGAFVVARDSSGRTAGSILTDDDGDFSLEGLDNDVYTVYAVPLDDPVSAANLMGGFTIQTDFEPAYYGATADLSGGGTVSLGTLSVDTDVALNLGRNSDTYPLRAIDGLTMPFTIRGTGLSAGSTLTASDPDVTVTNVNWLGSQVAFSLTIPVDEPIGHFDLQVVDAAGDLAVLPGAVEITPLNPTVVNVVPSLGSSSGGDLVTITGTDFHAGARVVIGDQIYVDGQPGGCTVVSGGTITLTTAATVGGTHDVVVIDPSGEEGRLVGGFASASVPVLDTVFPPSGSTDGGTTVVLSGSNFVTGATVRIDGVDQPGVVVDSPTSLHFVTVGGPAGGPYTIDVTNPGGGLASSVFAYVSTADPELASVAPFDGKTSGGEAVTLTGTDFSAASEVWFGVDAETGLGGVQATDVVYVDDSTILATTPPHSKGAVDVLVRSSGSGQAAVLGLGFTYTASSGSGGGGCWTRPVDTPAPPTARDVLAGSGWMLLLGLALLLRARRRLPALARR